MLDLTVVCPFYNEAGVVGDSVASISAWLDATHWRYELVLVDDGSTDGGRAEVLRVAARDPRIRVLGYARNRGRGHALRTGIAAARGDLVCTMEADAGYGLGVVGEMVEILRGQPQVDMVLVSPGLPGGGYVDVPPLRALATHWGNKVLRWSMASGLTTHTGMTRCYRRRVIQSLPLHEDGKEFHLEVVSKALALGYAIAETPGTLRWPASRRGHLPLRRQIAVTRRNAASHLRWAILANPTRFLLHLGVAASLACVVFAGLRIFQLARDWATDELLVRVSVATGVLAVLLFGLAIVAAQVRVVLVETWRAENRRLARRVEAAIRAEAKSSPRRVVERRVSRR